MKNGKYKVNKKKSIIILFTILLIAFQFIFIEYAKSISNSNIDKAVIIVSWLSIISFILELILWKKLTNELFSPFGVFFVVLFVFTLGQTIGWTFGIDLGTRDWWNRNDHGMTHQLIFDGIIYSSLSLSLFFLGSIIGEKITSNYKKNKKNNFRQLLLTFEKVGKFFLFISIPAFIIQSYSNFTTASQSGYASLYIEQSGSTTFKTIIDILANFYQPSLLLLLISNKDKKKNRLIILFFMFIDVFIELFVGGRSNAVMTILGIILAYHYFIKPINKKNMTKGVIGGYFGIAVLNCIAKIRDIPNKNLTTFFTTLFDSFSNALGYFIGELGWNLSSICWTMKLVPSKYPFRCGKSYLASFLSVIPSSFFGGKRNHPTVIYSNVGDWLQESLNMSYGPGYTMVAESYINFAWFGIIAMLFMGFIVSKFIAKTKREDSDDDVINSTFQIVFIMTVMKSLIRSSFSSAFRIFFFNVLIIYVVIKILSKKQIESK